MTWPADGLQEGGSGRDKVLSCSCCRPGTLLERPVSRNGTADINNRYNHPGEIYLPRKHSPLGFEPRLGVQYSIRILITLGCHQHLRHLWQLGRTSGFRSMHSRPQPHACGSFVTWIRYACMARSVLAAGCSRILQEAQCGRLETEFVRKASASL